MTTTVLTVSIANANPSYGTAKGDLLTPNEMDANLNTLSTGVNTAQDTADAALPKAGGTITGNLTVNGTTSLQTTTATAVTLTSINGVAIADYARKSINNNFSSAQSIDSATNAFPLYLANTNTSGAFLWMYATAGGAAAAAYRAETSGTGKTGLQTYGSGSSLRGELYWQNDTSVKLDAAGATVYNVTAALEHNFYGAASGSFKFRSAGGAETLQIQSAPNVGQIATDQSTLYMDAATEVRLRTTSGATRTHLKIESTGQHSATGVGYTTTPYPIVHCRASAKVVGGTATWNSNGMNLGPVGVSDTSLYTFSFSALPTADYDISVICINGGATNPRIATIEGTPTVTGFAIRINNDGGARATADFRIKISF